MGSDSDGLDVDDEIAEDAEDIKLEVLADRVAWTRPAFALHLPRALSTTYHLPYTCPLFLHHLP